MQKHIDIIKFMEIILATNCKRCEVICKLVENIDPKTNIFPGNNPALHRLTNVSLPTVCQTLLWLQRLNFLKKTRNNNIMINPDFVYHGTKAHRKKLEQNYIEYKG
jgi:hypothetical protein